MEDGMKSRSFRHEEYSRNRRLFLRSYPLRWDSEGDEEDDDDEEHRQGLQEERSGESPKLALALPKTSSLKSRVMAVFHWGRDKFLILKRTKMKKVVFYLVSCHHPFPFKSSSSDKLLGAAAAD